MSLNEKSKNIAYVLGRLFAVLEKAQEDANPGINATIKDRYFNSACATPSLTFPVLYKLAMNHMKKAEYGYVSDMRIEKIMSLIEIEDDSEDETPKSPFPSALSLEDQGIFVLGYYHQKNALYGKKKEIQEELK